MHEDRVVEIYWIGREDQESREADHVRTCDETIVPENLHAADKKDLCRGLTATVDKAKSRPMSSWLTFLMASMAYSLTAGSPPLHMGETTSFLGRGLWTSPLDGTSQSRANDGKRGS